MSGMRNAEKGKPALYKDEARWRKIEMERELNEEAPDVNRKGAGTLTKNPGGSGTQATGGGRARDVVEGREETEE